MYYKQKFIVEIAEMLSLFCCLKLERKEMRR